MLGSAGAGAVFGAVAVAIVVKVDTDAASIIKLDMAVDATVDEEVVLVRECPPVEERDIMVTARSGIGIGAEMDNFDGALRALRELAVVVADGVRNNHWETRASGVPKREGGEAGGVVGALRLEKRSGRGGVKGAASSSMRGNVKVTLSLVGRSVTGVFGRCTIFWTGCSTGMPGRPFHTTELLFPAPPSTLVKAPRA